MAATHVLAIDQGTTGSTAVVLDAAGAPVARAYSEFTQHYPRPGWVEHDADEIWRVTLAVARDALAQSGVPAAAVAAIGLTNQRETTVLWDRATGRPVAPAIVWQDRRTADFCERLRQEGREALVRARTGLLLDPYFSATKLRWLLDRDSALRLPARDGRLAFGTIDSWLLWNLTGGKVHATDPSNASRTLLFNLAGCAWDPGLLDLFGIPAALLPEVRPSSGDFGLTDPALFGAAIPVRGIAGDQQAALFGQRCHRPGMAKCTYGTGAFALVHAGTKPPVPGDGTVATVAWQIGRQPVEYALEGSVFICGAAVQWLRDGLGLVATAAETEALARSVDSSDGVVFVPALSGLGAPDWDPQARGLIIGLTRGTSRAHLVRAALEGMAFQVRDVIDAMVATSGVPLELLRADGGAAANTFLMQFQADLLGVPIEVPRSVEATALGAGLLAGIAAGVYPEGGPPVTSDPSARYQPVMPPETRSALHARWRDAVSRSRHWAL